MNVAKKWAVAIALVAGIILGGWSTLPVSAEEEEDPCGIGTMSGCCNYTLDCGAPSLWRCCLPQSGEAQCAANCPNYCINQQSCSGM